MRSTHFVPTIRFRFPKLQSVLTNPFRRLANSGPEAALFSGPERHLIEGRQLGTVTVQFIGKRCKFGLQ